MIPESTSAEANTIDNPGNLRWRSASLKIPPIPLLSREAPWEKNQVRGGRGEGHRQLGPRSRGRMEDGRYVRVVYMHMDSSWMDIQRSIVRPLKWTMDRPSIHMADGKTFIGGK